MMACSSAVNFSPRAFFSIRIGRIAASAGSGPLSGAGARRRSASSACGSSALRGEAFAASATEAVIFFPCSDLGGALVARHVPGDEEVLLGVARLVVDGREQFGGGGGPAAHREIRVDAHRPRLLLEVGV